MTTSSDNPLRLQRQRAVSARAAAGFTLVEVMVCGSLGCIIMLAVCSTFYFLSRSGTILFNYVGMETEARRGLEKFSEDTRMGSGVTTTTATWPYRVAITIPHKVPTDGTTDTNSDTVTYWWDNTSGSSTYHCILRQEVDTSVSSASPQTSTTTTTTIVHNVQTFQFDRWQSGGATGVQASSDANTDQLQLHLTLNVQGSQFGVHSTAVVAATNLVISARYLLRNKL